jgi:hypothetical protein
MTDLAAAPADVLSRWHHLLLRLSGRMPDDLLAEARGLLAHGLLDELADRIRTWAVAFEETVTSADASLLAAEADQPQPAVNDDDVMPPFGLAPVGPDALIGHGDQVPQTLDLTGPAPAAGYRATDGYDRAISDAANSSPDIVGVWRTWRFPTLETPWAEPTRIYLVEAIPAANLPAVTWRCQQALAAVGASSPLVESYADADALPTFHRYARANAALIWAPTPAGPIELARVFDGADPATGPYFDPAHPRLPADESARVLAYLRDGVPLLATGSQLADIVEPGLGTVVPMTFRTDGRWIWTDAVAYYLERHELAPDADLLAWIRERRYQRPAVDGVAAHRAMAALLAT